MRGKLLAVPVLIACFWALLASTAGAQGSNEQMQLTYLTFSQPVEIPGMTLDAGTYMFKVINSWAGSIDVVQVSNKAGTHLYKTILTIPDYHLTPTGDTVVTFRERAASSPDALRAWFYPGRNYGHEFVYPKSEAAKLAAANHENVPSLPDNSTDGSTTGDTFQNAHVTMVTPDQQEVEVPQQSQEQVASSTPGNASLTQDPPKTQPQNNLVAENTPLPKTASSTPLIALMGILLMASSILIGLLRRFSM